MRRGDLLVLVSDYDQVRIASTTPIFEQWDVPTGTMAVFLETFLEPSHGFCAKYTILVDGRVGWVYETECERVEGEGGER